MKIFNIFNKIFYAKEKLRDNTAIENNIEDDLLEKWVMVNPEEPIEITDQNNIKYYETVAGQNILIITDYYGQDTVSAVGTTENEQTISNL